MLRLDRGKSGTGKRDVRQIFEGEQARTQAVVEIVRIVGVSSASAAIWASALG
jgi:hypothetical protein